MKSKSSLKNLPIFFFIIIILTCKINNISIISSSSLEKCRNDSEKGISCKSKILLSLTIQNAELQGSDSVETTLEQVVDKDGNIQKFTSPIKIVFSKTPVKVLYPGIYVQDFNYFPKEYIISSSYTSCKDSITDEYPTCGWAYSNNEKISYSQGFCCSCSVISFSESIKRGTQCDGFLDFSATAHCLRFDDIWYSAYKIEKYKIEYKINVTLINATDNSIISILELSPENTINTDSDKNILVKLIGDFLPTDMFPRDLSNKYLIIPSKPDNHIVVKAGTKRWMLVDKERFTLDGNECD